MRTFETPEPITADLNLEFGGARIIASDSGTTVVDVRPADETRRADVEAAERTSVHFASGRLGVRAPRQRSLGLFGRPGKIDVVVELPAGSALHGEIGYGDFETEGRLGDCTLKSGYGKLRVGDAGAVDLHTSGGEITVDRVAGAAEISSSAGNIRIGEAAAAMTIKTSAGDISVRKARAGISARTAYGGIRVVEAARGLLSLATSYGDVEIGVAAGTATLLDVTSNYGSVHNELEQSEDRTPSDETLTVRAHTSYGDITIRRA